MFEWAVVIVGRLQCWHRQMHARILRVAHVQLDPSFDILLPLDTTWLPLKASNCVAMDTAMFSRYSSFCQVVVQSVGTAESRGSCSRQIVLVSSGNYYQSTHSAESSLTYMDSSRDRCGAIPRLNTFMKGECCTVLPPIRISRYNYHTILEWSRALESIRHYPIQWFLCGALRRDKWIVLHF